MISALACTADGKRVFSGTIDGTLYESTENDGYENLKVIRGIPGFKHPYIKDHHTCILALSCNHDGSHLFSSSRGLLSMWSDYTQDLRQLDTDTLEQLFRVAQIWHETKKPLMLDHTDERRVALLSRYRYLQNEKLFVRPE